MSETLKTPSRGIKIWPTSELFGKSMTPIAAKHILKLRFGNHDLRRMKTLLNKAKSGTLTETEQFEIDSYEQLGCALDVLHSQARLTLKKQQRLNQK